MRSLKEFAHPDQAHKVLADLNQAIRSTLVIAHNEYHHVAELTTQFGDLPSIPCFLGEINQVVLNLVVNAAHAIADVVKDSGELGKIDLLNAWFVISVVDEVEIAHRQIRALVFRKQIARESLIPFFTTKEVGKGTGQGLRPGAQRHRQQARRHAAL